MTHWLVMSPEYDTVLPILEDGSGPIETGRDVAEVEASTKAAARRLGYAKLKGEPWFRKYFERDKHPYAYLTVENLPDRR